NVCSSDLELGRELVAPHDVDVLHLIRKTTLLEHDRDLVPVGCRPVVKHDRALSHVISPLQVDTGSCGQGEPPRVREQCTTRLACSSRMGATIAEAAGSLGACCIAAPAARINPCSALRNPPPYSAASFCAASGRQRSFGSRAALVSSRR